MRATVVTKRRMSVLLKVVNGLADRAVFPTGVDANEPLATVNKKGARIAPDALLSALIPPDQAL
jgi:hypothetical protein